MAKSGRRDIALIWRSIAGRPPLLEFALPTVQDGQWATEFLRGEMPAWWTLYPRRLADGPLPRSAATVQVVWFAMRRGRVLRTDSQLAAVLAHVPRPESAWVRGPYAIEAFPVSSREAVVASVAEWRFNQSEL